LTLEASEPCINAGQGRENDISNEAGWCAPLVSTVSYANVSGPAKAGAYPFATTFTPASGGSPVPFAAQHSVTVGAGALASIRLSPATASITSGSTQAYAATGYDACGNSRGAITNGGG
jgi:hypothetical protein